MGQGLFGCLESVVEAQVLEHPESEHNRSGTSSSSSLQVPNGVVKPKRLRGPDGVGEHKLPSVKTEAVENDDVPCESIERSANAPLHMPSSLEKEKVLGEQNRTSCRSHMPPDITMPKSSKTGKTVNQPLECRMRLFNFNMGNSDNFANLGDLLGPSGNGSYKSHWKEPFADGCPVDVVFTTLAETRLNLMPFINEYQEYLDSHSNERLNALLSQNARKEGGKHTKSKMRNFAEKIGAHYSGNLKTMLAFNADMLDEDEEGQLFGRLEEGQIAGLKIPNPKKAFMGRSLTFSNTTCVSDIRICFTGAHFPIARLAAALEIQSDDALSECKIAFARSLRRVLKKAADRRLLDDRTLLVVQGDLNTRTVLHNGEVKDVLLEILSDTDMQAALIHELDVPCGCWQEPVKFQNPQQLPVTYKFHEQADCQMDELTVGMVIHPPNPVRGSLSSSESSPSRTPTKIAFPFGPRSVSFRSHRSHRSHSSGSSQKNSNMKQTNSSTASKNEKGSAYRASLASVGDEQLEEWGLQFKKNDFRAFRFPASADRVICWVPDCLDDRLTWKFPSESYQVNYKQQGSDHRPVTLDIVLQIKPLTAVDRISTDTFTAVSEGSAGERMGHHTSVLSSVAKTVSISSTATNISTKVSLSQAFENSMRANPALRQSFLELCKADEEKEDDADSEFDEPGSGARAESVHFAKNLDTTVSWRHRPNVPDVVSDSKASTTVVDI